MKVNFTPINHTNAFFFTGEECYPRCKFNGYCVIVNNELFSPPLHPRFGSSKDADDLMDVFSDLRFATERRNNLTKKEVMDLIIENIIIISIIAILCILLTCTLRYTSLCW